MSNTTKALNTTALAQFTGSERWYCHPVNCAVLYTGGTKYVAENAGAHWLLDEIALSQRDDQRLAAEEFQFWILAVNPESTGTLTCEDGNDNVVFTKTIDYTDFPGSGVTFYYTNNTILLPGEY